MIVKKRYLCTVFAAFSMQAQEIVTTTGGNTSSNDGMVHYSLGQIFYTEINGQNTTVWAGVQQPFEVSEVLAVQEQHIDSKIDVYPNPVTEVLNIDIGSDKKQLSYFLYDSVGRIVRKGLFSEKNSKMNMEDLPAAVYFLLLKSNSNNVKVIKLIKK